MLLGLGVFEAVERVVLREHDDRAEALVGQAEIGLADVDLDRFGIADLPRGLLRALQVAAADRDGQFGMKPPQGLRRLGADDARSADDEDRVMLAGSHCISPLPLVSY